MALWSNYLQPHSLHEALELKQRHGVNARFVAGGTDLVVEHAHRHRTCDHLIDISRIDALRGIKAEGSELVLGALATHNDVVRNAACRHGALPLAEACWTVGAPQLRTRATVAGNIVTGSPANDTITALVVLDARVRITSARATREVPISQFHTGVRKTVLEPDEMVTAIVIPTMPADAEGHFVKLGLRQAQAISVVNAAAVVRRESGRVTGARIALGSVAPTIVRAPRAEAVLIGNHLDAALCDHAAAIAADEISPITDVRGSREYRLATAAALVSEALQYIAEDRGDTLPDSPVLLETIAAPLEGAPYSGVIETTVNGQRQRWSASSGRTLLTALREEARLTGTKEGCGEGECGACTVWINGQAVMSCLTPAGQAHGAMVTTIEGLGSPEGMHPVQDAFVSCGGVQCGFCIPGMVMAATKLLDEQPHPDDEQIRTGLSGNLCRCTGYRKILDAVRSVGAGAGS